MSVQLQNIDIRVEGRLLVEQASLTIKPGHKVGITGANGCGKSTLFKAILGDLSIDAGELQMLGNTVIATVKQETPNSHRTALDYALDGDAEYRRLQDLIEHEPDAIKKAHYLTEFEHIDGYSAEARAGQLLHGLGFQQPQLAEPVNSFSGGWRMRLNLAQALMKPSNLLLLDEPTNHLDLDAVLWLESWLKRYEGTLLLISHDRAFLDSVCEDMIHFHNNKLALYRGNYSQFEAAFAAKLSLQQTTREKQLAKAAHLQKFVDRFKAKASKAKQAQSRVKALEKLTIAESIRLDSPLSFDFADPEKLPDPMLSFENAQLGYPNKVILDSINFTVKPGDRFGLLGRNGAGKSTLIKTIAGEIGALGGDCQYSTSTEIGYFAQHQLELLHPEHTALDEMNKLAPEISEQQARDYLGRFRFSGERIVQKVGKFSGGEKARLVLALLIWRKPNLLLMDEPTNHLDMDMREALTIALQNYQGAIILVSHDRFLLEAVCDDLLLVNQGQITPFDGDLNDYATWLKQEAQGDTSKKKNNDVKKVSRQEAAQRRAKLKPFSDKVKKIEMQLEKLGKALEEVEAALADPELYDGSQSDKVVALNKKQSELAQDISLLEDDYFEAAEALEEAEQTIELADS
jgi:ATP-binding cassette, subfamily F, member 3